MIDKCEYCKRNKATHQMLISKLGFNELKTPYYICRDCLVMMQASIANPIPLGERK